MLLKTGIDLIEIPRIQAAFERHGERFLKRVFTELEVFECRGRAEALAVRFAAKEAASKALGTGIGPITWREVETLHKWSGEPYLVLHGSAERIAREQGLTTWAVSLSHSRELATAVVVATGD
ncbi:MAG TPA: holo-ACP synthase [Anaerolineales bacterium]|nr:holo-ACP synthase [Anaerolineales bacterium]